MRRILIEFIIAILHVVIIVGTVYGCIQAFRSLGI